MVYTKSAIPIDGLIKNALSNIDPVAPAKCNPKLEIIKLIPRYLNK